MIIPTSRLLFLTAVFVLLVTVATASGAMIAVVAAFFLLVCAVDSIAGRRKTQRIHATLPLITRLSKNREGFISVLVQNVVSSALKIRLGLPLPASLPGNADLTLQLPEGSEFSQAEFVCTPERRGKYLINKIYIEVSSPLKLWNIRRSEAAQAEIRVYPNLSEERRKLSALFLNRGDAGIHARRMVGQGREFEKLREYAPGDAFDQIFWKATARRGKPITKLYQVERTQEVYVIMDFSRLSDRRTGAETNLEFYIRSALLLGLIAQQQSDLFGLLTFADRIGGFIRAGSGKAHFHVCRDAIYTLEPRLTTPDYRELFSFVRLRLRRRALLVLLTDLSDPVLAEQFTKGVDLIARQHLILVNMMRPPAALPLFSRADAHSIDDLYRKLSGHLLWQNLHDLENTLHLHGVKLTQLDDANFSANIVTQYLSVKQRQIL